MLVSCNPTQCPPCDSMPWVTRKHGTSQTGKRFSSLFSCQHAIPWLFSWIKNKYNLVTLAQFGLHFHLLCGELPIYTIMNTRKSRFKFIMILRFPFSPFSRIWVLPFLLSCNNYSNSCFFWLNSLSICEMSTYVHLICQSICYFLFSLLIVKCYHLVHFFTSV